MLDDVSLDQKLVNMYNEEFEDVNLSMTGSLRKIKNGRRKLRTVVK